MEDLNAASLDDVKEWFRTYYGAANAVLVIAGDVDARGRARRRWRSTSATFRPGRPSRVTRPGSPSAPATQRQIVQDRVPQARIYKVWNVPQYGTRDATTSNLVSDVLAQGKTSRLYKRLVYDEQIATDVVGVRRRARDRRPVHDRRPRRSPAAISAKVEKAHRRGDRARSSRAARRAEELERAQDAIARRLRPRHRAHRRLRRQVGHAGARAQVYGGDPDAYKTALDRIATAHAAPSCSEAAQRWLTDGVYVLEVHPFPEYATTASDVDRSKLPAAGDASPTRRFPTLERATLSNGLKVVLAERACRFRSCDFDAAGRRRLRRRPVRRARHGQARDEHAGRGHDDAATRSQISDELRQLGATARHGLGPRHRPTSRCPR